MKPIRPGRKATKFVAFCFFVLGWAAASAQDAAGSLASGSGPLPASGKVLASPGEELLIFPATTASPPVFLVPDPLSTTLRILTSLAVVIALVFVLSFFLQRRGPLGGPPMGRLLGIFPLDGRRHLYVVDILGKVLVLGVTEHQISLVCEITEKSVIDGLRVTAPQPTIPGIEGVFRFLSRQAPAAETPPQENPLDPDGLSRHTRQAEDHIRKLDDMLLKSPPKNRRE